MDLSTSISLRYLYYHVFNHLSTCFLEILLFLSHFHCRILSSSGFHVINCPICHATCNPSHHPAISFLFHFLAILLIFNAINMATFVPAFTMITWYLYHSLEILSLSDNFLRRINIEWILLPSLQRYNRVHLLV